MCDCICDCGTEKTYLLSNVIGGKSKSCGCLRSEATSRAVTTHGLSKTRLYGVWGNIITRCYNENNSRYKFYGGRGIKMCDEWRSDFYLFYKWCIDNGYDENSKIGECTIDRIDVNGDYEPNNCRFVNMTEQANNKTTNVLYDRNGESHTLAEWCRLLDLPYKTTHNKLSRGYSFDEILTNGYRKKTVRGKEYDLYDVDGTLITHITSTKLLYKYIKDNNIDASARSLEAYGHSRGYTVIQTKLRSGGGNTVHE